MRAQKKRADARFHGATPARISIAGRDAKSPAKAYKF